MLTIVSRLDITQIFCDVDDFCQQWENLWQQVPQLPSTTGETAQQIKNRPIRKLASQYLRRLCLCSPRLPEEGHYVRATSHRIGIRRISMYGFLPIN